MIDTPRREGVVAVAAFLRPLGDAVRTVPELRYLARMTGGRVTLLVKKSWQQQLYEGLDYIGDVLPLEHWRMPVLVSPTQLRLLRAIRRTAPRHAFILSQDTKFRKLSRLFRFAGLPRRGIIAGIPGWNSPHSVFPDFRPDARDLAPPVLHVSERERQAMRDRLAREFGWEAGQPIVVLHPGCGAMKRSDALGPEGGKNWGWGNWAEVAAGIAASRPEALVVFTGSADERELTRHIIDHVVAQRRPVTLAGATSMRELLALQSLAHSGIATNTGASHTAMAVGCPLVSIFGNHDPRRFTASSFGWGPCHTVRGADMEAGSVAKADSPITRIRPATVLHAWHDLPSRPDAPGSRAEVAHYLEGEDGGVPHGVFEEEARWGL